MARRNYMKEAEDLWYRSPTPHSPKVQAEVKRLMTLDKESRGELMLNVAGASPSPAPSLGDGEGLRRERGIFTGRELDLVVAEELASGAKYLEANNKPLSNPLRAQVKAMLDDAEKLQRNNQPPPRPSADMIQEWRRSKEGGMVLSTRKEQLLQAADYRDTVTRSLLENKTLSTGLRQMLRDLVERAEALERENA